MNDGGTSTMGGDPFTTFWTDLMGQMATVGFTPPAMRPDMTDQMRKAFFSVLSNHAEEFMRSEQFLAAMKQSMDNALAFKQQMNQFFQQNLRGFNMPSSADADHVALLVRGMEDRVMEKLDDLDIRLGKLESSRNGSASADKSTGGKTPTGNKPKKGRR